MCVCDGQWVLQDRLYRPPDVYNLVSTFKQFLGFVGQMVRDAVLGGWVGLVYVDSLHGAAQLGGSWVSGVEGGAPDCVVEDEDFGCAGSIE